MRKVAIDTNGEDMNDEMKPEYDLRNLRVRRVGAGRKNFGGAMIRSKPVVAEMSPDSELMSDSAKK